MDLISTTPFGPRPFTAALMKRAAEAQHPVAVAHIDKWALFRDLCTARHAYTLSDRDMTVLNALLSFLPGKSLCDNENLIVFPSNKALSDRAHGMAESTLRRHLAALVRSGIIQRHDSPNGKRYAARGQGGDVVRAFGFDLRPMLVRAKDITYAAAEAHAAADRLRRLREEVVVLKRDALKLCLYGQQTDAEGDWTGRQQQLLDVHKQLRRKTPADVLQDLLTALHKMITSITSDLETHKTSGTDAQNERHFLDSHKDSSVFEPCLESPIADVQSGPQRTRPEDKTTRHSNIPLGLVLKACPDILPYAQDGIVHWHQLIAVAGFVRGMMGISSDAWIKAQQDMGAEIAAITVVAILQRISQIQSPGGYLRALTRKAAEGAFSPGPMVMALLNTDQSTHRNTGQTTDGMES